MTKFYSFSLPRHLDSAVRKSNLPSETQRAITMGLLGAGSRVSFTGSFTTEEGEDKTQIEMDIEYMVDLQDGHFLVSGMVDSHDGLERCYFDLAALSLVITSVKAKTPVKHLSQVRRELEKADRDFPKEMFTPGTHCIVKISSFDEPKEITVKYLVQNGPDSFCIETGIPHESPYMNDMTYSYNISHVVEVLEHKSGKLVIADRRTERQHHSDAPGFPGGTGRYHGWSKSGMILQAMGDRVPPSGTILDLEKLVELVDARGVFRNENMDTWCSVVSANKTKLKRAVSQLYNRALMSAAVAQDQDDEMMNEAMSDMWDSRDDEGHPDATRGDRRDQRDTCDAFNAMDYDYDYD